ncbi:hypothetical protein C8R45DRAFT_1096418 [Mycena sanguinolenta]|nr:hypothetical protein C8R45DRAFT_1096418 [Mycena sanguinolenta]
MFAVVELCHDEAKANVKSWIAGKGLKGHLQCSTHLACYANHINRRNAREEQLQQLDGAYNAEGVSEYPQFAASGPLDLPSMFPEPEFEDDIFMNALKRNVTQLIEELGQNERPQHVTPEEMYTLFRQQYERMLEDAYAENTLDGETDRFIADDLPK